MHLWKGTKKLGRPALLIWTKSKRRAVFPQKNVLSALFAGRLFGCVWPTRLWQRRPPGLQHLWSLAQVGTWWHGDIMYGTSGSPVTRQSEAVKVSWKVKVNWEPVQPPRWIEKWKWIENHRRRDLKSESELKTTAGAKATAQLLFLEASCWSLVSLPMVSWHRSRVVIPCHDINILVETPSSSI